MKAAWFQPFGWTSSYEAMKTRCQAFAFKWVNSYRYAAQLFNIAVTAGL
jgi:hypothetical protein